MKLLFLLTILVCCSVVSGENGFKISNDCQTCLNKIKPIADDIKKVAVDVGPITTCAGLCELVKKETNDTLAGELCELICAAVGINELKKFVNNTELNYGLYCEETKKCPKETGAGSLVSATVNSQITSGQDINIKAILSVSEEIGLIQFLFECPKNKTTPDLHFYSPLGKGSWEADWSMPTGNWKAGIYICDIKVCNTICNSFPKRKELGKQPLTFEIKKAEDLQV